MRRLPALADVRSLGAPVGAWILAAGTVVATTALSGRSPYAFLASSYGDPGLYEDIAREGYTLFPCWTGGPACGNAGWFPAYPWLMRWISDLGVHLSGAAIGISWLFTLGTLVLLWVTFLERRLHFPALAALAYAAFVPGQIYGYTVYPLSMLWFFTVAYLWCVRRERWLLAGLIGYVLVLVYPDGIAPPIAATIYILATGGRPWRHRLGHVALAVGPAVVSLGALLLEFQDTVGHWNAYFLVQRKYHHELGEPFGAAVHAIHVLVSGTSGLRFVIYVQSLVVTAAVLCVLVAALLRRRSLDRTAFLLVLWTFVAWLIPHATTELVIWRQDATLLPMAVLVGRLPPRLALGFVSAGIALSIPMCLLFVRHTLG